MEVPKPVRPLFSFATDDSDQPAPIPAPPLPEEMPLSIPPQSQPERMPLPEPQDVPTGVPTQGGFSFESAPMPVAEPMPAATPAVPNSAEGNRSPEEGAQPAAAVDAAPAAGGLSEEDRDTLSRTLETAKDVAQHVTGIAQNMNGIVQDAAGTAKRVAALEQLFSKRLQYDDEKEKIIDRQHAELVELRDGLKKDLLRPLLYDIAEAMDDIRTTKEGLAGQEHGQEIASALDGVSDSLLYILEKNDVEQILSDEGDAFSATRQRMVKSQETTDSSKRKIIAKSIAPGYVLGKETIFKEKVVVYKVIKPTAPAETPAPEAAVEPSDAEAPVPPQPAASAGTPAN